MRFERITSWQLLMLLGSFLIGTSTIILATPLAGRSGWLATLLALVPGVLALLMWWQLSLLWKKPLITGILEHLGPILGSALSLLYLLYFLLLASLITADVNFLSSVAVLPETPKLVFASGTLLLSALAIRGGLESIGRLAEILLPLIGLAIITGVILIIATPQLVNWNYLFPLVDEGWLQTIRASISIFCFPFGEVMIFTSILPFVLDLKDTKGPSLAVYILAGLLLAGLSTLQTAVLGEEITRTTFPGFSLLREIRVADFVTRLEVLGIFVWSLASFVKVSIYFWALTTGLAQLLGLSDYRPLLFPLGIIITLLSVTIFTNFSDLSLFIIAIYPLLTLPMQLLIPLALFILTRLKPTKP